MKLLGTNGSPFVRKVRLVLAEKGIACEYVIARPSDPRSGVAAANPLSKIPVLIRDDGRSLYDSSVIVEYLDGLKLPRLIPENPAARIEVKRWEALADGISEAAIVLSHDLRLPAPKLDDAMRKRQLAKIECGLDAMEAELGGNPHCYGDAFSLADIACAMALGYLDAALAGVIDWRAGHPRLVGLDRRLAARPAFATALAESRA
jgi:glutathione S-transferase